MVEFSLRNSTGRPCLGEIQADCQPCCPFETNIRCLSMRYSRVLGGKIEFSDETSPREKKSETGWRRGLDSNSRLSFTRNSRFIGGKMSRFPANPDQERKKSVRFVLRKKFFASLFRWGSIFVWAP